MAFTNVKARMAYFAKQSNKGPGQVPGSMGKNLTSNPSIGSSKPSNQSFGLSPKPIRPDRPPGFNPALPKEPSMPHVLPNEPKGPMLPKMAKFPRIKKFFKS